MKKFRAESLDALRGFAIFMMVLSGTIISWVLPAWMSHAQCPPPSGAFDPSIYGITWVDLVFPFFLFSMGAAFPFAIGSRIERGAGIGRLIIDALWRFVKLTYFALFIYHVNPWVLSSGRAQTVTDWLITLAGFILLFAIYLRIPGNLSVWTRRAIHWAGVAIATALMVWTDCRNGGSFNLYQSNIIILVLANMAAFGTPIYILTIKRPWARAAVLPFLMAIILCKDLDGTWQQAVYNWSPAPWLYQFHFLKYLFIVIPGTYAGEFLRKWINENANSAKDVTRHNWTTAFVLIMSVAVIALNVWMLFARHLVANLFTSAAIVLATAIIVRRMPSCRNFLKKLTDLGGFLLMAGIFFEAFDGGIRKDPSSFNYWLTTSGLACYCLTAFVILCDVYRLRKLTAPFTMSGKNPMIAYVAAQLFVMPVLNLCHIGDAFTIECFTASQFLGFIHGFIVTALSIMTAMYFTRIKWFWRT